MTAQEQWFNCLVQGQNDRFLTCQLEDLIFRLLVQCFNHQAPCRPQIDCSFHHRNCLHHFQSPIPFLQKSKVWTYILISTLQNNSEDIKTMKKHMELWNKQKSVKQIKKYFRFEILQIATLCLDDSFAHSWHSLGTASQCQRHRYRPCFDSRLYHNRP